MPVTTGQAIDVDQIERLVDKVKGLIALSERTRSELARAHEDNQRLQNEVESLRAQLEGAESASADLKNLMTEREQVRNRVEDLLQQLETIDV